MTFKEYRESRDHQEDEIIRILSYLYYQKKLPPEQVATMDKDKLWSLVQHLKPTQSWNDARFVAMIRQLAKQQSEVA